MKLEALSLRAGIAVPVLYFGTVFLASLFYPSFSLVGQYASELGAEGAPHPQILNIGLMLVGFAAMFAAYGFWRALRHLDASAIPKRWTWCIIVMFGVAMWFAGFYPHPDWRHFGFGLSFPLLGGPAMLAAALWNRSEATTLNRYLIGTNIFMVAIVAIMFATGRTQFAGLLQLLYSLAAISWIGVGAYMLSCYVTNTAADRQASQNGTKILGKPCSIVDEDASASLSDAD
ncbi:MAG: DUF998 domain-containing protein [Pirellulaceae bacterium]